MDLNTKIYTRMFSVCQRLTDLKINGNHLRSYSLLSEYALPLTMCSSSIIVKLKVDVHTIDDCMRLLDGRFNQMNILNVITDSIDTPLLNFDATTSTENSIVHNINRDLTVNDNIIVNDVLISLYDLISDIDNNRIENENYDTTLCMNSISTIVVQDTHQNIYDNEVSCSFAYPPINRPTCIKISLPGVRFITDQELKFVDEQRLLLNDNTWFLKGVIDKSKSSRSWFTEARSI
ncbi:unnamed protein product [Rotaria magnacalcarata]|uniref:Uncharacterized protein n=1 Tax=Rotaria magnacalcarata TaxID=392030 RepID=A0A816RDB0_9BILA|nr:unnamed protein product [Rotaria magnacalcarata]